MDLTTVARVKALLDITGAQHDTSLGVYVPAVSQMVEEYLNRTAFQEIQTDQLDVEIGQRIFLLRAYPVLAAPAPALKHDLSRIFGSGSELATDGYYLNLGRGRIQLDGIALAPGPGTLKVVYTGGMATTTAALITAFPAVARAVDMQTAYVFKRRDSLGAASISGDGGSISLEAVGLLPMVKEMLQPFRRMETGS